MKLKTLKAPFPAFGGKSKVAPLVWERFGVVPNYVEPFCFSAAVLLGRPDPPQTETVNDANHFVSNFWRAVQADPEAVAAHADWPVNETDLHARHNWLMFSESANAALENVRNDPDAYDARVAGWWCWGACCWIGSGWCDGSAVANRGDMARQRPQLWWANGVNRKLPQGRVQLADAFSRGRGVNSNDKAATCAERRVWLTEWMRELADRLRTVRVCCGDWERVCGSPSTTTRHGTTAVFLDPPYRKTVRGEKNRDENLYANDGTQDVDALCDRVFSWCKEREDDPMFRIALCGYEGEYNLPGWDCVSWKANGGYGNRSGSVNDNAGRERIWFSPHCVRPDSHPTLFGDDEF